MIRKFFSFYLYFIDRTQEFRKEMGISITQLCTESHVSTRTFARFTKGLPIKPECCFKLLIGCGFAATKEEFMKYWIQLGEWLYRKFCKE